MFLPPAMDKRYLSPTQPQSLIQHHVYVLRDAVSYPAPSASPPYCHYRPHAVSSAPVSPMLRLPSQPAPPPRSLNREALEEVLQQESAARPVCGSRSEATTKCSRPNGSPKGKRSAAKPSSLPSHPSLFDILPISHILRKYTKLHRLRYKQPRMQYSLKTTHISVD